MLLLVTLGLLAAALGLAYYYFTSTFNHWKVKGVRYLKPIPFFGNMWTVFTLQKHMMSFFHRMYHQMEGERYFGFFQSRRPSLVVRDPELLKNIMVKDFSHFMDHGFKIHEEADPLEAKSLFNLEGQRWRDMRVKLTPTFTSGRMKAMFPLVKECADQFEQFLGTLADSGEENDIKDLLSRFTTDVIGSCAFGIQCNSIQDPNCKFREMGRELVEMGFFKSIKMFFVVFMPEFMTHDIFCTQLSMKLKLAFLSTEVTEFFRNLVRDVIALRAKTGTTRKDFMQLLIELKEKGQLSPEDEDDKGTINGLKDTVNASTLQLTHDDITAQAMVFFTAGFETSSTVVSFALLELAANPEVQERAQREVDEVLSRHDGAITYQTMQDMTYLEWILQESMRKYPPLVNLMRVCTKNYVIPGTEVVIEEGTPVIIPIHAMQNDPKYFPDPDRFDPERFSDDQRSQKNQYVYMPFGEGPRQCIGNRFALMQSKLGLMTILHQFNVHMCKRTTYPVVVDPQQFMTSSKGGIWLKITRRNEE